MDRDDLIDRIYEAAALPEVWPTAFHDIAVRHGFVGGSMFSANPQFQRGVASPGVADLLRKYFEGGWQSRNRRPVRAAARNHAGFERDEDLLSDEEIATDPIYTDLLRPNGFGYCAGSLINCPNGDMVAFSFERAGALGPTPVETLAELDKLRPHLARAASFSARLDLERSQSQVAALTALGLAGAVMTSDGRALASNELFERLDRQVAIGARDRVILKDPAAARLLAEALAKALHGNRPVGRSLPLRGPDRSAALVLHLLPVRRDARDVFSRAAWLLVATPLGNNVAPGAGILSGLFDLTPAEARVARGLIEGHTVSEIAAVSNTSVATVRNQLRAVFLKTGASRQSELVAMCGGLGLAASAAEQAWEGGL